MSTAEKTTLTVVGTIAAVGQVNEHGYANIKIEGSSGEVWVSSNVPGLIGAARNAKGETMAVDYVAVEGKTINKKTGRPFINNHLEAVRLPAADELPARQYSDDDLPFGQEEDTPLAVTVRQAQEYAMTSSASPQDEFRRSKAEMRFTASLEIAAQVATLFNVKTLENLETLARNIEQIIEKRS